MTLPHFDALIREQLSLAPPSTDYALDCFVSSEVGYNEVLARCQPVSATPNGAYLGVGPDQNYTYIGALRPRLAVILDARLDNLLEHLVFKLAFSQARDPLDYLCLLFGRRRPAAPAAAADAKALVAQLHAQPLDEDQAASFSAFVLQAFRARWSQDSKALSRVKRLLGELVRRQLKVTSVSERCLANLDKIPDFEEVITATTPEGFNFHYLTDAERFGYVKALHGQDAIVPLLGNVVSPRGIAAARSVVEAAGLTLSAVYLSNLEEFLLQRYIIAEDRIVARPNPKGAFEGAPGRSWHELLDQLSALPCDDDAVLIRFYFPGEHRGRRLGVFPWLVPHVTPLARFLRRCRDERPSCVLETYE